VPEEPCPLPQPALLDCLRTARRGSAAGPSGATNEHLRILLDDEEDAQLLHGAGLRLARAELPPAILEGLRVGRLVALRQPNGRVRALVVGDAFRRLVGRVLAKHFASQFQEACMPHQYGLSTRTGTEAVSRLLRAATEALENARRCRLVVVGIEVGGRFGAEAVQFLRFLASHRAASIPAHTQPAAVSPCVAQWSRSMLTVAAQRLPFAGAAALAVRSRRGGREVRRPPPEERRFIARSQTNSRFPSGLSSTNGLCCCGGKAQFPVQHGGSPSFGGMGKARRVPFHALTMTHGR